MHVYSYPTCVVNRVRFLTHDRDNRWKTQNSDVTMPPTEDETFYSQLHEILEISYLNSFSVILFKYKWFKCDVRQKVTENNIKSFDISAELYKDDQFILISQVKHIFLHWRSFIWSQLTSCTRSQSSKCLRSSRRRFE